jgi:putative hydrolase of HD superfamily
MTDSHIPARLDFIRRAERLKDTVRSGHTTAGRSESVAEHTWRLALLIMTFADLLPGIDLLRLLKICILHDLGEAVGGDIPAPMQIGTAAKATKERSDFEALLGNLPSHIRTEFLAMWDDYEDVQSHEAEVAKAFDKIETILQHNQGRNPEGFDYAFNLEYGRRYTDAVPIAAEIRDLVDADTAEHVKRAQNGG